MNTDRRLRPRRLRAGGAAPEPGAASNQARNSRGRASPGEARTLAKRLKASLLSGARDGWFRGKDSNLRSRIQSPLPYLLATPEKGCLVWARSPRSGRRALEATEYAKRLGGPHGLHPGDGRRWVSR